MKILRLTLLLALPLAVACGDKDDGDTGSDDGATDDGGGDDGSGDDGGSSADGEALYATSCAGCHAADGSGGAGPDLNSVVPGMSQGAIESVILDGEGGMPAISVTADEASAIASYVLDTWG